MMRADSSLRDDPSFFGFDGDALRGKISTLTGLSVGLNGGPLTMKLDPHRPGALILTYVLQRPKLASRHDRRGEAATIVPAVQAAMGLDGVSQ